MRVSRMENLESRTLMAMRTVDFADYPVRFDHFTSLTPDVGPAQGGLTYTLGVGDGQRTNKFGVTWPDSTYYNLTLGVGGFDALNAWPMRPIVIYNVERNGDWRTQGWNLYQDMAEGPACVDDTARAATTLMEDYIRNGTESSFQRARDALTYISYLMGRDGRMYNFTFLDGPTFFNWSPIQSQNLHYGYRAEYVKRTQYPPGTGSTAWLNPYIDPDHIVGWPNPQDAPPFLSHPRYSIYMNDLRDGSNNDVAATWWGPIFTSTGESNGVQSDRMIKQTYTTSRQQYGFEETRTIEAYGKALLMLAKRSALNGGLTADETFFARFIENHANRVIRNLQRQSLTIYDSKLQSVALAGLCDYYRVMHATTEYGTYTPRLASNSGTPLETTDDRLSSTAIMSMIDTLATDIRSELFRTSDWRNGIFISNAAAGNWASWGEFQIAALSKAYQLKKLIGASGASVEALLDDAVYAAENFYGKEAYHYSVPGMDNVRTKERTVYIQGWNGFYHTNADQSPYHMSSIIHGLAELTEAYAISGRADAAAKRDLYLDYMKTAASWWIGNNNTLLDVYDGQGPVTGLPMRGRGASFDGIGHGNGNPWFNRGSGGESNIEGLRVMIVVKDALARHGKPTTFAFETGTNRLPAGQEPQVTLASYDPNTRALKFRFNKDVGASVDTTDLSALGIDAGGAPVAHSAMSVAYNNSTFELSYLLSAPLPNGNYRATLRGVGITDNFSSIMLSDRVLDFFVLAGDANNDRHVDEADQAILTAYLGQSGNFSQGDFDYDGTIDSDDQAILTANWRIWLPPQGGLLVSGTSGADTFRLRRESASLFELTTSGLTHRVCAGAVTALTLTASTGDDTLVLDWTSGAPLADVRYFAHDGTDTVQVIGTRATNDLTVNSGSLVIGPVTILLNAVESRQLAATATSDLIRLRALTVNNPLTLNPNSHGVLLVDSLSVSNTSALDLKDHDLIVNNGSFSMIRGLVLQGFGSTTGITSSGSDGSQILALFDNAQVGAADWEGIPLSTNAVVGKYTFFGDTNLDGQVSGDDYTVIDANLNTAPPLGLEWLAGDMNLDGIITGDDYTVIDANLGRGSGNPLLRRDDDQLFD